MKSLDTLQACCAFLWNNAGVMLFCLTWATKYTVYHNDCVIVSFQIEIQTSVEVHETLNCYWELIQCTCMHLHVFSSLQ